jgi:hypothetical protein
MNRKSRRPRNLVAKLLLVLIGFLLGAVVAEIALRVAGYSYPEFYTRDSVRGAALLPGAEGWFRKEGEAYVRINSDGLRDQEHSVPKPANTFRIAILGDSYSEALSVSLEEAFWFVMGRKLQNCPELQGKNVEVINFGVSGYGTALELLTLREKVWKYSPDLVLLAVTTNNDVTDNSRALKKTADIPYFVFENNQLTLDNSFRNTRAFAFNNSKLGQFSNWFVIHSRVVQAVIQGQRGIRVLLASRRAKSSSAKPAPSPTDANRTAAKPPDAFARSEELGVDNVVYLEPNNPVWNDAWRVTEALLRQMRDEVKAGGATFIVVTLSNGPQVLPEPATRENFKRNFGVTDLFYPDNRFKAAGERDGFPVITLAPELQGYAERNKVFLHGFGDNIGNGHWNPTGHRVAGELIAEKLCQGGLLK